MLFFPKYLAISAFTLLLESILNPGGMTDLDSLIPIRLIVTSSSALSSGMWIEESPYYIIVTNYFQDKYVCDQWRYIFRQIEESADCNNKNESPIQALRVNLTK